MAVCYNRHRQKDDFSRHLGSKRNFSHKNDPENICVKYINNRYSPDQIHNSNITSDQKTITITVKKKTIRPKKQKMWKENEALQRVKKSKETSLITIWDYLKVLGKKRSTPDAHQPYDYRNQKQRRSSDTSLNISTPFKTKTVVNTLSMDPKKIPPDCKNLLNHPLMQAQLSIYRCQLNTEKKCDYKTCNSAAIFEVVKCLYDCYKKKKCDPCKCVVCGYLPRDIRKLINEVGRSSVNVGVGTGSTNRKTISTMTSEEDELLSLLQNEVTAPKQCKITASEKLRMAKAFGILTSNEFPGGDKIYRAYQRENNDDFMTEMVAPCPLENISHLEKTTNLPDTGESLRVPSKKLRKARAYGLLTPLEGKTQQQREKMLRHLAMNDIPLPEGKTESEKILITKVRRELGLPPGPRTAEEKERYAKAQASGLIKPLKGKSQPQKENILRSLLENGIPLPEGRTPQEKTLIDKIELGCSLEPATTSDTEKTIKHRARSYVHTLFNKFATKTGYMVLVETSCVKDKFCNLQEKGFLTPIEDRSHKQEANIFRLIRAKETKSLEKALFKEVEIGVRLIPESQDKTHIRKVVRGTGKESVELHDGQILVKKFIKRQRDPRKPLEERIIKSKGKLFPSIAFSGNPLSNSRKTLENPFDQVVINKARPSKVILERTHRAKLRKSESEQANIVKGLADAILPSTKDYVPLEKESSINIRLKPKVLEKKTCQTSATVTETSQKISKGMVTKLISKLVSHLKEDLDNTCAGAAKCERGVACDTKRLSFRKSYLTIKLSVSDVSNVTIPRETRNIFTDTKDMRHTSDIATSLPSIANSNSTVADETETLDNIPTKEIKKNNKNNSPNDKSQTSGNNSQNEDSKSAFCFYFASDTDDTTATSQSHDNNERDLEENTDLIYIYKPAFEYNAKEMLETSSKLILTDSYNISPNTSGSLYLIETGSTDSYDSGMTDFSYATKERSESETGTDVFYVQQSEDDHAKDTSSEHRIVWYYRNSIHKTGRLAGRDAKVYLLSEEKTHQKCNELPERTTKQVNLRKHWNVHNSNDVGVIRTAPRQSMRRSSSIIIVLSPSRNQLSSEDLASLIYVEKLDSVSKLKTIKLVPHENTQNPIKMCRRHRRNVENIKHTIKPRTEKYPETRTRPVPASYKLPLPKAFTRYPYNKTTSNRGNRLEYSSVQFQKPRIPPKYSDSLKMTTGHSKWNKELSCKQPSCTTTCRLGLNPEQRITRSGKQRVGPKYLEKSPKTTDPASKNNDPLYKAITRYLDSTKRPSFHEKPTKCSPDQRLITGNSKVCLISTAHSSKCSHSSRVSFSDESKYPRRGKSSQGETVCKNSSDDSSRYASDEKAKGLPEKVAQFTLKMAPKSSKFNLKTIESRRESKVRFDRTSRPCCPCERTGSEQPDPDRTTDAKKAPKQSEPDLKKELKPWGRKKKTSQQSEKNLKLLENEKNTEPQSNSESKDKQISTKGCCSQCGTVKRATSPMNVNVKSVGVDGSSTSKPSLVDKPKAVSPEKEKISEKPPNISDRGRNASFGTNESLSNRKKPTMGSPDNQPADGNFELDQMKSECLDRISTRDSTMQPTNECVKQEMVLDQFCPSNSTPDQIVQPPDVCVKLNQQTASECAANSSPDSVAQSAEDNAKLSQGTEPECPANFTQDSIAQPAEDDVKQSQQVASECPVNSAHDSNNQPASEKNALNQNIPCQNPVESSNHTEQPVGAYPEPPANSNRKTDSNSKPCDKDAKYKDVSGNKEEKNGRYWWCKKKRILLHRPGHPEPPRSVEENSMETQCERDVRDLSQMTDNLLQMADEMMRMRGKQEQCLCGETVKPCECLHKLAQTMITGGVTITKPTSKCECPPQILIIKGHQLNHYGTDDFFPKEQESLCSCIPFLKNHNTLNREKMIKNPKNIKCECPQTKATGQTAESQNDKDGTCQGMPSGPGSGRSGKCECPRPATKGEQHSCDNLAKVESDQSKQSQKMQSGRYRKTVICESPSKNKLQLSCSGQKTVGLKKKSRGQAGERSSSDDCTECQNKKTRVKWCQKKAVITECPPPALDDPVCLKSQRKKQIKKNAKNQAKVKTGEKKVETLCTPGATPCICKDEPLSGFKKNHKCECPYPFSVEEVDLNSEKYCPPESPCPKGCPSIPSPCRAKNENEKKNQKKTFLECDQGQMTEDKKDQCSYTDRPIKNICKTKNKSSGQGKWGKKKLSPCICPPVPSQTERGCDPPCVKDQWKMRSRETRSKSGFSVKKRPAPRVDLTMCFEEALAYFEQHPEDDPMQKKKKRVTCECSSTECCNN